jgi:hypothetical protein
MIAVQVTDLDREDSFNAKARIAAWELVGTCEGTVAMTRSHRAVCSN